MMVCKVQSTSKQNVLKTCRHSNMLFYFKFGFAFMHARASMMFLHKPDNNFCFGKLNKILHEKIAEEYPS